MSATSHVHSAQQQSTYPCIRSKYAASVKATLPVSLLTVTWLERLQSVWLGRLRVTTRSARYSLAFVFWNSAWLAQLMHDCRHHPENHSQEDKAGYDFQI